MTPSIARRNWTLCLLVFALAGFGAGGTVLADAPALAITMTDGVISPQRLELPAGQPATLTVTNAGKSAAEFESKPLHIEQVIAPGGSATFKLQALPKGSYKFVDEFHENLPSGRGEIVAK